MTLTRYDRPRRAVSGYLGVAVALGATAALVAAAAAGNRQARQLQRVRSFADDAPPLTRRSLPDKAAVSSNTVTINRPRAEIYDFWRDFDNLPRFMENIHEVRRREGGTFSWTIAGPARATVDLLTEIVDERQGERIAWRTLPESEMEAEGAVAFRDLPGGRGTAVEATVRYHPPGGEVGRWLAKLFQREPNVQGRRELRRLKMLMEAGEIATASNRKTAD